MCERLHALPVIQFQRWRSQLSLLQAVGRASAVDNGDMYLPGDENRCCWLEVVVARCAGAGRRHGGEHGLCYKNVWWEKKSGRRRDVSRSFRGPKTDPLETGVTSLERKFD